MDPVLEGAEKVNSANRLYAFSSILYIVIANFFLLFSTCAKLCAECLRMSFSRAVVALPR